MTVVEEEVAAVRAPEVDLETLLSPIAGDNPCGELLRYEGTYDAIREAQREEDPTLPQGVWVHELKKGDWAAAAELCRQALESRTKDLQIGVWLLQAWLRLHGLGGAAAGLRLLAGLVERFWDGLYPEIDDGDLEARLAPLEWLNSKVPIELKAVSVTRGERQEGRDYSWLDWEWALHATHLKGVVKETKAEPDPDAPATRSEFLARVSLTPTEFYESTLHDIEAAGAALAGLRDRLTSACGDEAPSLSQLQEALVAMGNFATRILMERKVMEKSEQKVVPAAGEEPAVAAEPGAEKPAGAAPSAAGTISSRAGAYRLLSLAADYLMRTEPHSPAPYLVRRAIAWGGMSLADVLREMLSLGTDLDTVYKVLGIEPTDKSEQ